MIVMCKNIKIIVNQMFPVSLNAKDRERFRAFLIPVVHFLQDRERLAEKMLLSEENFGEEKGVAGDGFAGQGAAG